MTAAAIKFGDYRHSVRLHYNQLFTQQNQYVSTVTKPSVKLYVKTFPSYLIPDPFLSSVVFLYNHVMWCTCVV